jgi:hypothetical protein
MGALHKGFLDESVEGRNAHLSVRNQAAVDVEVNGAKEPFEGICE